MKAIILAAGRGSRMRDKTEEIPKGLIKLTGISLVERMLKALKHADIKDIALVTGYKKEGLDYLNLPSFYNANWATTNMVFSLACAQEWLQEGPVIVCYSDIFVDPAIIKRLKEHKGDFIIAYDENWQAVWEARFENIFEDAESFKVDNGLITDIGRRVKALEDIQGQYMGIFKLTPPAWANIKSCLNAMNEKRQKAISVTELLQSLLKSGAEIIGMPCQEKWGEVDTPEDLIVYEKRAKQGVYGEWF